jgi:hypothetical protein
MAWDMASIIHNYHALLNFNWWDGWTVSAATACGTIEQSE